METISPPVDRVPAPKSIVPLLHALGAGATALGAVVLMVEGLGHVDAVARLLSFSLIMTLTAGLGLLLSAKSREQRGARTLIALFLALVPVFWSQLGSVLYNVFQVTPFFTDSAGTTPFVLVEAVGAAPSLGMMFAAFLLMPFTYFGARVLMPHSAARFSALLGVMGVALALPMRTGVAADAVVLASALIALLGERLFFCRDEASHTKEALWARAVLLTFPAVMIGRGLHYHVSASLFMAGCELAGALFYWLASTSPNRNYRIAGIWSDAFLGVGLFAMTTSLTENFAPATTNFLAYLIPALYLLMVGLNPASPQSKAGLLILALGGFAFRHDPGALAGTASLIFPMTALCIAVYIRSPLLLLVGGLTLVGSMANFFINLWNCMYHYRWSILMLLGIFLVCSASSLEKITRRIRSRWIAPHASPQSV